MHKLTKQKYSTVPCYSMPSLDFMKVLAVSLCASTEAAALVVPHLKVTAIPTYADSAGGTVNVHHLFDAIISYYNRSQTAAGNPVMLEQLLQSRATAGELGQDDADQACDILWDAWAKHHVTGTDYIGTARVAADAIRTYETRLAIEALNDAHATRAPLSEVTRLSEAVTAAQGIGKETIVKSSNLHGFDIEAATLNAEGIERCGCGIAEIDAAMGMGPMRGEFGFWLAGAKVGKSMALVQNAACGLLLGYNVFVVTLELQAFHWKARLLSALTSVPTKFIITPEGASKAASRLSRIEPEVGLGQFHIVQLPGHDTTVAEVIAAFKRTQQENNIVFDMIVIDYADKLIPARFDKNSDYVQMREVYEKLRLFCVENRVWGWTASQAQRIEAGTMPSYTNVADSVHKLRVVDFVLGLCRSDIAPNKKGKRDKDDDASSKKLTVRDSKIACKVLAVRNGDSEGCMVEELPNGFEFGHLTLGAIDACAAIKMERTKSGSGSTDIYDDSDLDI